MCVTREILGSFLYKTWITPGNIFKVVTSKPSIFLYLSQEEEGVKQGDCMPRMSVAKRKYVIPEQCVCIYLLLAR